MPRPTRSLAGALLLGLLAARPARSDQDVECRPPARASTAPLDWSDGRYRICSPQQDREGRPYPGDFRMRCTVYVDAAPVGSAVVGPGRLVEGRHGRTGRGVATARCETLDGRRGAPAEPREVKLSR